MKPDMLRPGRPDQSGVGCDKSAPTVYPHQFIKPHNRQQERADQSAVGTINRPLGWVERLAGRSTEHVSRTRLSAWRADQPNVFRVPR